MRGFRKATGTARRGRFGFTPTATLLRRIAFYGILLFVLLLIQTSLPVFAAFEGAVPALVLAAVSAIGFFDSERSGAVAGIAAGWALDAFGGATVMLMPLVGLLTGYIPGIVAGRLLPRGILPWGVCLCGVCGVNMLATVVNSFAVSAQIGFGTLVVHTLLPELLFSLLLGIPAGLLARLCVRRVKKGEGNVPS